MTLYEIQKMLENHKHWLNHDCPGWEHMRADLSRQDLTVFGQMHLADMDLRGVIMHETILDGAILTNTKLDNADLSAASFVGADMQRASMTNACLNNADLRHANLTSADLHSADLCFAKASKAVFMAADMHSTTMYHMELQMADLTGANMMFAKGYFAKLQNASLHRANLDSVFFCYSNLSDADLYGANLCSAILCYSDLTDADLRRTCITDTDFYRTDLRNANFKGAFGTNMSLDHACVYGATEIPFVPMACPDSGSFIGWKKASGKIVCLEIPADAKRTSATNRRCRCDKAKVLSITEMNGDMCDLNEVPSDYDETFIYRVGETVSVKNFCEDRWKSSAPGIYFFLSKKEAVQYQPKL